MVKNKQVNEITQALMSLPEEKIDAVWNYRCGSWPKW